MANEPIELSDEQKIELRRRLTDQYWRLNNLYWIQDVNGCKVKFKMNAVQEDLYWNMHLLSVVPKSRQHGCSTLIDLLMLDICLFNTNKTGGIIDRTDTDGQKKLGKLRFAYEHLDDPDDPDTCEIGKLIKMSVPMVRASEHEIRFGNESQIWTATSLRGGTVQFLHISELGPIAYADPIKAEEIRTGAFNTVHPGNRIVIESTHKGGRFGLFYEMIQLAQKCPAEAGPMDWKLFFYGWWMDPKNKILRSDGRIGKYEPVGEEAAYFDELHKQGIKLSGAQKLWWSKKKQQMGDFMSSEYPSTMAEMLDSVIKGAIYGPILAKLRNEHKVVDFPHDPNAPLYTFWDLGQTDLTCIWLAQFSGPNIYLLDYYSSCRQYARKYVEAIEEWQWKYNAKVQLNVLPHDADVQGGKGPSWRMELDRAGLKRIACVPKTSDKWIGINAGRRILQMCMIHASNCGKKIAPVEDQKIPSGLEALECYRIDVSPDNAGRTMKESPVHDEYSHGADAFRTLAEAMSRGMLHGNSAVERSFRNSGGDVSRPRLPWEDDDDLDVKQKPVIAKAVLHPRR